VGPPWGNLSPAGDSRLGRRRSGNPSLMGGGGGAAQDVAHSAAAATPIAPHPGHAAKSFAEGAVPRHCAPMSRLRYCARRCVSLMVDRCGLGRYGNWLPNGSLRRVANCYTNRCRLRWVNPRLFIARLSSRQAIRRDIGLDDWNGRSSALSNLGILVTVPRRLFAGVEPRSRRIAWRRQFPHSRFCVAARGSRDGRAARGTVTRRPSRYHPLVANAI